MASLTIQAQANMSESVLKWNPDKAEFNQVLIGKGDKFKLELQNTDSTDIRLEVVSEPDPQIVKKYKIKKDKLKPNQTTEIEFELREDLPPGVFKTTLTAQIEGSGSNRFSIPITGTVVEKISPEKPVAASHKKPPAKKSSNVKSGKKFDPNTGIQVKKPVVNDRAESKPATQTIPLSTIDDSDLK